MRSINDRGKKRKMVVLSNYTSFKAANFLKVMLRNSIKEKKKKRNSIKESEGMLANKQVLYKRTIGEEVSLKEGLGFR